MYQSDRSVIKVCVVIVCAGCWTQCVSVCPGKN
jgi:hypothetical protein